uniref:Gsp_57 putative toxin n=1 Tax=Gemmula speciosa TaxID=439592 RepID=A0A098LW87_GEMSP
MMAKCTVALLVIVLLSLQQYTDGNAVQGHMDQKLPNRFIDVLSERHVVRQRYCPDNKCERKSECPSTCSKCEKKVQSHRFKFCQA